MKKTALLGGLVATTLAFTASAETSFESYDRDGDGRITAAEAAQHEHGARIAAADTDGDGVVTREEFDRARVADAGATTGDEGEQASATAVATADGADASARAEAGEAEAEAEAETSAADQAPPRN